MADTHFGFTTVDEREKASRVRGVFDSVAKRYDVMNDVMSMGLHRAWKAYTVAVANLKAGDKVLDIAGGTGDLARAFAAKVGDTGVVVGASTAGLPIRRSATGRITATPIRRAAAEVVMARAGREVRN